MIFYIIICEINKFILYDLYNKYIYFIILYIYLYDKTIYISSK